MPIRTLETRSVDPITRLGVGAMAAAGCIIRSIRERKKVNTSGLKQAAQHLTEFLGTYQHFTEECEERSRIAAREAYLSVYVKQTNSIEDETMHRKLHSVARVMLQLANDPLRRHGRKVEKLEAFCNTARVKLATTTCSKLAAD